VVSGVTEVRVTRSRDVLEGQILPVTGRLRRHGRLELLVVLPDGTSRLIPQAWTDAADGDGGTGAAGATLGSVSDLLASCALVAALGVRAAGAREQAARKSPCKEDNRAACAAQSAAGTGSGTSVRRRSLWGPGRLSRTRPVRKILDEGARLARVRVATVR
jgi:hypothetical protein